eukprot:m.176584 g.176584  ORF g.176584 m.176584 type:complete len:527 (-) comp14903_c0_seq4:1937-3517(-)
MSKTVTALALITGAMAAKQPHLVFFLADDYGFADVGYHAKMYGHNLNPVKTPNLDALSATGIRLENYYIQPVCSPTRATLLTGRYVFHHGVHVPFIDSSRSTLPLNESTLAERLKSAGYATHMIGKWHLGFRTWAHTPTERGFDTYMGYYAGSQDYYNHQSLCWPGSVENGCFENTTGPLQEPVTGLDLHNGREVFNSTEYSTIFYTDEASAVIAAHAAKYAVSSQGDRVTMSTPLFLYLPYQAVHVGNKPEISHPEYGLNQAPQWYVDMYADVADPARRNLSAMITVMDEAAGNVTAALQTAGMWKDTIFIFSTDNGGPLPTSSNYPLFGGKGSLWQGGVRGVGFVCGGDLASFGFGNLPRLSHVLIHVSDWNPTLCEFAGGCPMPSAQPLDGVSAWGALTSGGNMSNRTEIVHDLCLPWMGGSCLERITEPTAPGAMFASIVKGDFKLIVGQKNDGYKPHVFNIAADPGEANDLIGTAAGAATAKELLGVLAEYAKGAGVAHDRDPIDPKSNPMLHGGVWMPWE